MKGLEKAIGITILWIGLLSAKSCPAAIQTYVSKSGYSTLLFAQQTSDSVKIESFDSRRSKSPWIAFGIALVPGAIVHGAGYFYAGRIGTGLLLLGTEVVGASLLFYAAVSSFAVVWGGEYDQEVELWAIGGLVLFMGSWVCDVVGSPIAVNKQNKNLLQRKQGKLRLQMKDGELKLVTIWSF
jgi:TM2 domain-containing membrane protein YozV